MSVRRAGGVVAMAVATLLCVSCGDVYRPVVIPTGTTPPNPANFHAVFGVSNNSAGTPGAALQIDVAGDSNIGSASMGINPTHAAILPSNSRVFVTSSGSMFSGESDVVTSFTPAIDSSIVTGLGNPVVFSMPFGSLPVFVNTAETTAAYVANFGTNSVSALSILTNTVRLTSPVGSSPVALAETPNAQNLYVLNQGDNTVMDLSPIDLSMIATIPVGSTPVWAAVRPDSQRVYVLTQGESKLYTIRTDTNVADGGLPVGGPGANYVTYDKSRNRLYVTNPGAGAVFIFDATSDPPTPLGSATGLAVPAPVTCAPPVTCSAALPVSVAPLPDGSRFYVASYQTISACPDPNVGTPAACIIPMLTIFDALSLTIKPAPLTSLPAPSTSLSLLSTAQFPASQYAVPTVSSCASPVLPATYAPGDTRFRMFATASADSSHVYASICDAGTIADIVTTTTSIATGNNTPDSLVTDITAPIATCVGTNCGTVANITGFSIASNAITFQAANNFVPGQLVSISGLTSTTGALLDGQRLEVLATGLSATQFETMTPPGGPSSATATSDAGTAVPIAAPQNPIFLLTGQ